ncbi:hypothetical protein RA28_05715 [Ruegeria sp. ANG-S4]|nr:hypothetical protein RA28_05715 [Ruegeria sp. ANG-S4]
MLKLRDFETGLSECELAILEEMRSLKLRRCVIVTDTNGDGTPDQDEVQVAQDAGVLPLSNG